MKFRRDINGLRAIAVISVVLFHFNESWMPGGFAGVDVFFVISGFLMTSILFSSMEKSGFSIVRFYLARANRIIPALAVLCICLMTVGLFFLPPLEYKALAKHSAASISFLSNFVYWTESGYFDVDSHRKWLLHTWSLSVEWQFYLIYPVLLLALRSVFSVSNSKKAILALTVIGFAISAIASSRWPDSSYFLIHTRAWEMLFGGLAYLYPLQLAERHKRLTEYIGILLILVSYVFITSSNAWPGYLSLLPVLGSYLIIQAYRTNSLSTGNVAFQYIGKWSYSIYLWHWPIVVAISYFKLGVEYTLFGLVLTLILGFLSYRFIESFKFTSALKSISDLLNKKITYITLIPLLATSFIYFNTNLVFGLPENIFKNTLVNKDTEGNGVYTWELHKRLNGDEFVKDGRKKVLVIGDSQAGDFINMLSETESFEEIDLVSRIIYSRCRSVYLNNPSLDKMFSSLSKELSGKQVSECKTALTSLQTDETIRKADTIVLAMHWHNDFISYLLDSIKQIKELNETVNILVISGKSFATEVPLMLFNSYESEKELSSIAYAHIPTSSDYNYELQHKQLFANQSTLGYDYINLFDFFCNQSQCQVADQDSNVYFYDKNHLTRLGVKRLGEKLEQSKFIKQLTTVN
ncbi:acyltransferase [Alteromonas sp. BL110]|uniref:acyltransferase family protein n=1 Tax=Alteromonas sp. BL110 TaxID=1714845 RepID=UPI000E546517|nr:acyltransferase family protein [Alteromonas sp. BL110]AXT37230.1 acyltransferase [Alteromonas sp. BL110]RKM79968.1 acyltransferase [Alteromonas sp. BL110]